MTYSAAGVLITDGRHVLAGYQEARGAVTGFGGKREGDEEPLQTAWRELFEELLGVQAPCAAPTMRILAQGDYVLFELSFDALIATLASVTSSPFYDVAPRSVADLIFGRRNGDEVAELALLPVRGNLHAELVGDIHIWRQSVGYVDGDQGK
jgi:hypothetical protein